MPRISKTKAKERSRRKTNPEIAETVSLALRNDSWLDIGKVLSGPTRNYSSISLSQIDGETKAGDTVVILGKVLSQGELTKKVRICALSISSAALDKLKNTKSEFVHLREEITKNKKAEGIKIIK